MGNLFEQKYPNNIRTVTGLNVVPFQDDLIIECDTSLGAVSINLLDIPSVNGTGYWSTQYKLYIIDKSNNAVVNNITVNAPAGSKINGGANFIINSNGASLLVRVASNINYIGQYSVVTGGVGNGHIIADEGVNLPQQPILDFQGANVTVTNGLGKTIVTIGGGGSPTIWNDVLNLENYVPNPVTELFKPQYTVEGNKITFRGLLYVPLDLLGVPKEVANGNSYLLLPSAVTDETRMSIATNANSNNGTPQGRFCTPDVVAKPNLPVGARPLQGDIIFSNVNAVRRYSNGSIVANYRTLVELRICGNKTVYTSKSDLAIGSILIFSPYASEYDGSGNPPLGNDPLALLISRATVGIQANGYIDSTDDFPFTIPAGLAKNDFSINAHDIRSLGGFIINLQGLSGYLN